MADPARHRPEEAKPKRPRRARAPVVYVVEALPSDPDPKAAERVLAWLAARLG